MPSTLSIYQLHDNYREHLIVDYLFSRNERMKYCIESMITFQRNLFLQLLWIILVASCAALIIQSLAANLGVVTGM